MALTTRPRKIFINLPVRDLQRSIAFFTELGFRFNPEFTDEQATCMIVSEEAFVMLLVQERFKDFTSKSIADARTTTEAIFALSAESREEVDQIVDAVLAAGGTRAKDPVDHGFMYYASFYDLDGHHWEVVHMSVATPPKE